MDLPTLWLGIVVTSWVLFFVLEGFDFGVGALAVVLGRTPSERGAVIETVGPVWDGNEVWLVAAIGLTFAAFPDWYAALLSGLYLPMVAILLALAARGVALEFRGKVDSPGWRRRCELALATSSVVVVALWGAVLGVLTEGLALGPSGVSAVSLLSGPALCGAALALVLAGLHGATFLGLRTSGALRVRARRAALVLLVPAALLAVLFPVALLAVALLGALVWWRREALAFAFTSALVALAVVGVFTAHLPVVLASTLDPAFSLTVDGAAASPGALRVITVAAVLVLPGVVAYQAFSYWVFRRRVAPEAPSGPPQAAGDRRSEDVADAGRTDRPDPGDLRTAGPRDRNDRRFEDVVSARRTDRPRSGDHGAPADAERRAVDPGATS